MNTKFCGYGTPKRFTDYTMIVKYQNDIIISDWNEDRILRAFQAYVLEMVKNPYFNIDILGYLIFLEHSYWGVCVDVEIKPDEETIYLNVIPSSPSPFS